MSVAPEGVDRGLVAVVEPDLGDAVVLDAQQVEREVVEVGVAGALAGGVVVHRDVALADEHVQRLDLLRVVARATLGHETLDAVDAVPVTCGRVVTRHVQHHVGPDEWREVVTVPQRGVVTEHEVLHVPHPAC